MIKTSKVLLVFYCIILGNVLLLGMYLRNYSPTTVYIAKREEIPATTTSIRINTTVAPTYPAICKTPGEGPLQGPVRPNLERAAELYWVLSNHSKPSRHPENQLGKPTPVSEPELKNKTVGVLQNENGCLNHTIAIIIPFRDREQHLQILLGHLIPILRRQGIRFTIFVVEQHGVLTFNKGRLMNTGFEFAAKLGHDIGAPYDCFIFQDVDLLVEHDTLLYRCSDSVRAVRHLSTAIDKFKYMTLCCGMTVGGVLGFQEHQFRDVNGFPNSLWGWGGEDDDINGRIRLRKLDIERPPQVMGRFTMIRHRRDALNPANSHRYAKLRSLRSRLGEDGLNNLDTELHNIELYPLFIKLTVKVGIPPYSSGSSVIIKIHKPPAETTPSPSKQTVPDGNM